MHCTASSASSPWQNFVSDTYNWTEENGAAICQSEGGIYSMDEVAAIVNKGAKKIWIDAKTATLNGSPTGKS